MGFAFELRSKHFRVPRGKERREIWNQQSLRKPIVVQLMTKKASEQLLWFFFTTTSCLNWEGVFRQSQTVPGSRSFFCTASLFLYRVLTRSPSEAILTQRQVTMSSCFRPGIMNTEGTIKISLITIIIMIIVIIFFSSHLVTFSIAHLGFSYRQEGEWHLLSLSLYQTITS